jgi:surface protein
MKGTFYKAASFNEDISNWDVSEVTNMESMFEGASTFNQDISLWNISKVTTMARMFNGADDFNQDIYTAVVNHDSATTPPYAAWNPTACTVMTSMFQGARAFNKDIGNWNINSVTDMESMFEGAIAFNQDISTKGIHKLAIYENNAWQSDKINTNDNRFNSTLSTAKTGKYLAWDTKNIANMKKMFYGAIDFDKDNNSWSISNWNTMSVTTIEEMFNGANNFNQDIRSWSIGIDIEMAKDGTTGDDTWNINVFGDDHVTPLVENSFQEGYKHETGYNFGSPKLSFFSRVYFISSNEELERAVNYYLNKDSGSSSQNEHPIVFSDQYSNNLNTLQSSLKNLVDNTTTDWMEDFETPLKVMENIHGVANSSFTDQKALLMNAAGQAAGAVTVAVGDTLLDLALALFNQYYPTPPERVEGNTYDIDLMGDSNVVGVNSDGAFKNGGIDLAYKAVAIIHAFFTENQNTLENESILSKPIVATEDMDSLSDTLSNITMNDTKYIDLLTIAKKGFIMTDIPDDMTDDEKALHFEDLKYAATRSYVSVWEYLSYHASLNPSVPDSRRYLLISQLSTHLALLYWCKHIKLPELKSKKTDISNQKDPDGRLNTFVNGFRARFLAAAAAAAAADNRDTFSKMIEERNSKFATQQEAALEEVAAEVNKDVEKEEKNLADLQKDLSRAQTAELNSLIEALVVSGGSGGGGGAEEQMLLQDEVRRLSTLVESSKRYIDERENLINKTPTEQMTSFNTKIANDTKSRKEAKLEVDRLSTERTNAVETEQEATKNLDSNKAKKTLAEDRQTYLEKEIEQWEMIEERMRRLKASGDILGEWLVPEV